MLRHTVSACCAAVLASAMLSSCSGRDAVAPLQGSIVDESGGSNGLNRHRVVYLGLRDGHKFYRLLDTLVQDVRGPAPHMLTAMPSLPTPSSGGNLLHFDMATDTGIVSHTLTGYSDFQTTTVEWEAPWTFSTNSTAKMLTGQSWGFIGKVWPSGGGSTIAAASDSNDVTFTNPIGPGASNSGGFDKTGNIGLYCPMTSMVYGTHTVRFNNTVAGVSGSDPITINQPGSVDRPCSPGCLIDCGTEDDGSGGTNISGVSLTVQWWTITYVVTCDVIDWYDNGVYDSTEWLGCDEVAQPGYLIHSAEAQKGGS